MNCNNENQCKEELSEIKYFTDMIYHEMLQCMTSLSLSFTNNICCVIKYTFAMQLKGGQCTYFMREQCLDYLDLVLFFNPYKRIQLLLSVSLNAYFVSIK